MTGALAGRALAGSRHRIISTRAATVAGAVAAAFPDIDFVLTGFGQLTYLELHQGVTHSLPMMPVWAWLLAVACAWVYDRRSWRRKGGRLRLALEFLPITLAGLAAHTVADLFNIWGVLLWWPLSQTRVAFDAIFVIDPLYSALVLVGLVLSSAWRVRAGAITGLGLVAAYTLIAVGVHAQAERTLQRLPETAQATVVRQYAAPPSLAHRRFVLRDDGGWRYAFVDLSTEARPPQGASWWGRFTGAYQPVADAEWVHALHPDDAGEFVADAWARPELAPFRDFVDLPFVHAVDRDGDALCAWFADLRFTLPAVRQPFVWGACNAGDGVWTVRKRGRW